MGIFFAWLIGSFIVGFIGSGRKIGFAGAFLFSLILSPIIGLIVALVSKDKDDEAHKEAVLDALRNRRDADLPGWIEPTFSVADELIKLERLKDNGVITKADYEKQKTRLLS